MQTIPNLCISAMGSRDGAAARSGLGLINRVGGASTDLFTLLVAPAKEIKVKLNVFNPHYKQTPSWGRHAWPLWHKPVQIRFPLAYTPTLRKACSNSLEQLRKKNFSGTCVGAMPFLSWFCFVVCGEFLCIKICNYSSWGYHTMSSK